MQRGSCFERDGSVVWRARAPRERASAVIVKASLRYGSGKSPPARPWSRYRKARAPLADVLFPTIGVHNNALAAHGCTTCHGGPGVTWAKFSEGLHPDPPDLKEVVDHRSPAQLFWVVRNGINMTGMPSFALAGVKDDEIWSIVAFLKKLPGVAEADYKAWTAPVSTSPAAPAAPAPPAENK